MQHTSEQLTEHMNAFDALRPRSSHYATLPIQDGFTWDECASLVPDGSWYMVVFRSVRREAGENLTLEMHDFGAYIEAQRRASGLVYYFRGVHNEHRECLSFCLWTDREEAVRAARLPLHRAAMAVADDTYESYSLERYTVRKLPGSRTFDIEQVMPDARRELLNTA